MPWLLRMSLLVAVMMAAVDLYLIWRTSKALKRLPSAKESGWKHVPLVLFSTFFIFPAAALVSFYINGTIDVLKFPKIPVYWYWFGLVFSGHLFTWIVLSDIAQGILRIAGKWDTATVQTRFSRVVIGLAAAVFLVTGFKMYRDSTRIVRKDISLQVDGLPEALEGFRIVHISDIQADEYTGRKELKRYIDRVNETGPGLVIFTGDLVSYGTDFIELAAEELSRVSAEYGTYAVVGDHDFWAGLRHVEPALNSRGIPLLRNRNMDIAVGDSLSVHLTGITNVYSRKAEKAEIDSLLSRAPAGTAAIRILAAHQVSPYMISRAATERYELVLGGHTHGGQVRIPLFWTSLSASNMETEFIQGAYREQDVLINIDNGLGYTLAPVRYNAPASISVIELTGSGY